MHDESQSPKNDTAPAGSESCATDQSRSILLPDGENGKFIRGGA